MAYNASDYEAQGRLAAQANRKAVLTMDQMRPQTLKGGWQIAAWNRGYELEAKRLLGKDETVPLPAGIHLAAGVLSQHVGDTSQWPHAAREHVARLVADYQGERTVRRRLRLAVAIQRMCRRHQQGVNQ